MYQNFSITMLLTDHNQLQRSHKPWKETLLRPWQWVDKKSHSEGGRGEKKKSIAREGTEWRWFNKQHVKKRHDKEKEGRTGRENVQNIIFMLTVACCHKFVYVNKKNKQQQLDKHIASIYK